MSPWVLLNSHTPWTKPAYTEKKKEEMIGVAFMSDLIATRSETAFHAQLYDIHNPMPIY